MTFTEDGYQPDTKEEIHERLRERFEEQFETDIVPGDVMDERLEAEAEVLAEHQEQMLQRMYDSAFLELATGRELTLKARELGIERRQPVSATGIVKFKRDSYAKMDYPIREGTRVQSGIRNPIVFETTRDVTLKHIDGFEQSLSPYEGDKSDAEIVNVSPKHGTGELKIGDVDGSFIYRTDVEVGRGSAFTAHVRHNPNTVAETAFCVSDNGKSRYRVVTDAKTNEVRLEKVTENNIYVLDAQIVTIPTGVYIPVKVSRSVDNTIEVEASDPGSSGELAELVGNEPDEGGLPAGGVGFGSHDSNAATYWDEIGERAVSTDVKAAEAGTEANLPADSITVMKDTLSGAQEVTNPVPTGNDSYLLISGDAQTPGRNLETDEHLRERAFDSLSGGGTATTGAIYTAVSNLEGVHSLSIFTNADSEDNTDSGGLPPYSTEVVVFGGTTRNIVETLYDKMSLVDFLRLHAGSHGSEETHQVRDEQINEQFTGRISRPVKVNIRIDVDIVTDSEFSGKQQVENAIVDYIGGTRRDGEPVLGLGTGDNVLVSELRTQITSVPGVVGAPSITLDTTGDGQDDTKTDGDGLRYIEVSDNEVAQVNADDGVVTINKK